MTLTKKGIIDLYRLRSRHYDITANLYYLIGFREQAYRKAAVKALNLHSGDTVVEIGCGTGLNFHCCDAAGSGDHRLIHRSMLDQASEDRKRGWTNVELVQSDAASYEFPEGIDGVISTFALTLVPEFDLVIRNGCAALAPGGRWVVLDFRLPSSRVAMLFAPFLIFLTKPFGVRRELAERRPWESIGKYLENVSVTEFYFDSLILQQERRETGYESVLSS
jgi:demethylmenaquinone methyltransferase/2-methoxy-6-polyprenyl-1,4-benzoquinol methylase